MEMGEKISILDQKSIKIRKGANGEIVRQNMSLQQEMIIDGTVTPANEYTPQQQQTPGELEEELEEVIYYYLVL